MGKMSLIDDLKKVDWIRFKCKSSNVYAQNLYAALCNNRFEKLGEIWSCSWRVSGEFVSSMRGEGTYLDWYCSGLQGITNGRTADTMGYLEEGLVTSQINSDILNLGWLVKW